MDLVEQPHKGIISILDEACLTAGKVTDTVCLDSMNKKLGQHPHYTSRKVSAQKSFRSFWSQQSSDYITYVYIFRPAMNYGTKLQPHLTILVVAQLELRFCNLAAGSEGGSIISHYMHIETETCSLIPVDALATETQTNFFFLSALSR